MAKMNTHVTLKWNGALQGSGQVEGAALDAPIAIPASFAGSGAGTDPNSLLVSAAASCYAMTLIGMLDAKKLPVAGLEVQCKADESKEAGVGIDYDVRLSLAAGATPEQRDAAHALISAADKACAIGNVLRKAGYRIEAQGALAD